MKKKMILASIVITCAVISIPFLMGSRCPGGGGSSSDSINLTLAVYYHYGYGYRNIKCTNTIRYIGVWKSGNGSDGVTQFDTGDQTKENYSDEEGTVSYGETKFGCRKGTWEVTMLCTVPGNVWQTKCVNELTTNNTLEFTAVPLQQGCIKKY